MGGFFFSPDPNCLIDVRPALDAHGAEHDPAQVPVQVGVADVEPEGPGRGSCGGLVDLGCPLGGLL